ncbi:MAG: response regulator [Gammaproteobacteria bacterium]|nr:response regulator [Gammaproteobacteria bacterium]MBU1646276.1 response regulator [Gammaproteobacteria bacterium]MBU1970819.1 response regulator [Gammaproteobacteria bacterium]
MSNGMVYLVDDDAAIRDALAWLLRTRGIETRAWASAEEFLAAYNGEMCGCLLLDIRMRAMGGLELYDRLRALDCRMPTIFLTGHGDVPMAVQALKAGAIDFLEKPFADTALVERIEAALAQEKSRRWRDAEREQLDRQLASLTEREHEVMALILAGKLNKVIADELKIAMRTVEVHRARVFEKMAVKSAVELARLLLGSR